MKYGLDEKRINEKQPRVQSIVSLDMVYDI